MELDILKYRAEAEYKIGDYRAAAHTYDVLSQVDGEKPEYAGLALSVKYSGRRHRRGAGSLSEAVPATAGFSRTLKRDGAGVGRRRPDRCALELYAQAEADGTADSVIYNQKGLCYLERGEYLAATGLSDRAECTGREGKSRFDV